MRATARLPIAAELAGTGPEAALVLEGEVANMSSDVARAPDQAPALPEGTQVMVRFASARDSVVAGAAP
jgi:hypothetical protein